MSDRVWVNQHQPQTLVIAQILLYIRAVFGLLFGLFSPILVVIALAQGAAANGIANEERWGYGLGIVVAVLAVAVNFIGGIPAASQVIGLLFDIALLVALLHPMSREYQRVWFR